MPIDPKNSLETKLPTCENIISGNANTGLERKVSAFDLRVIPADEESIFVSAGGDGYAYDGSTDKIYCRITKRYPGHARDYRFGFFRVHEEASSSDPAIGFFYRLDSWRAKSTYELGETIASYSNWLEVQGQAIAQLFSSDEKKVASSI